MKNSEKNLLTTKELLTAKPHLHKNVRGKPTYYLEVIGEDDGETHFINIGKSTYDICMKLQKSLSLEQKSDTTTQTKEEKK
jgi:hypothetical protein